MSLAVLDGFAGRRVLVTGASSGIGAATARALAAAGARVIAGGRDAGRLQALVDALPGEGHRLHPGALGDADGTAEWVSAAAGDAPLDAIFHAAGVELIRPARMMRQAHIDQLFGASVHAALGIARAASSRGVLQDGASIVFMSSVAAESGQVGMTGYCASKAAIDGLCRALALELAPRRIRANTIVAGAVHTPMHDRIAAGAGEAAMVEYDRRHPLGVGEPEDVAAAAMFLLGHGSRWVTGTSLVVDGGYLAR